MFMDPIAREVMARLVASGRANVRMDGQGVINWDDPTNPTGKRHLNPDMFDDALARLRQAGSGGTVSPPAPSYPQATGKPQPDPPADTWNRVVERQREAREGVRNHSARHRDWKGVPREQRDEIVRRTRSQPWISHWQDTEIAERAGLSRRLSPADYAAHEREMVPLRQRARREWIVFGVIALIVLLGVPMAIVALVEANSGPPAGGWGTGGGGSLFLFIALIRGWWRARPTPSRS
jgi:hypothetical protein